MGTRNLTIVVLNGKNVVAQYCQWDGYPSGQGATVINFLRDEMNFDLFRLKLQDMTYFIEDGEYEKICEKLFGQYKEWITLEDSDKLKAAYPSLHRDTGANILSLIQKATEKVPLSDATEFKDSGSCEWIYKIDLDRNKLTVYAYGAMRAEWRLYRLPTLAGFLKRFERE